MNRYQKAAIKTVQLLALCVGISLGVTGLLFLLISASSFSPLLVAVILFLIVVVVIYMSFLES